MALISVHPLTLPVIGILLGKTYISYRPLDKVGVTPVLQLKEKILGTMKESHRKTMLEIRLV